MPSWREVEAAAPELSVLARRILDSHVHKTLATLRKDGSPRISGTEATFRDGELWFGSMWRSVKALDLRRDPRFALHSVSAEMPPPADDPGAQPGDAKLAGVAEEITDEALVAEINRGAPGRSHLFRCEINELVVIRVEGEPPDTLVIESWHPARGVTRRERK